MYAGNKCKEQGKELDTDGPHFFPTLAYSKLQDRTVVGVYDEMLQQDIAQRAEQMQQDIDPDRQHGKNGFAHPSGCYRLK